MKSFAASLLATLAMSQDNIAWESLGKFHVKNAAFPYVGKFENIDEEVLLMSSFGAMSSGYVFAVPNIKEALSNADATNLVDVRYEVDNFVWPNCVEIVPYDVFNEHAIHVPDGFLVPMKTNGGIYIIRVDDNDPTLATGKVQISEKKRGFYYHMGSWVDMNGDGRKDFLTARSNSKAGQGELVWFEHPEGGLDVSPWQEHIVVTGGPDVGIDVQFLDQYPGEVVVFASEFWNERVGIYRVSLTDGSLVDSRIVDDTTILAAYSITYVDLNNDGKYELLVNNHESKESTNGIWAYTVPEDGDLMNGEFTKKTIATNFNVVFNLFVPQMSPGFPYPIWPHGKHSGERAHIFVAGDGDQSAHDFYPTGDNPDDFGYTENLIENAKGTVGALAFSDLDEDGWIEIWMPNYDKSTVELFRVYEGTGQAIVAEDDDEMSEFDFELDIEIDFDDIVTIVDEFVEGFVEGVAEESEDIFLQ